MIGRLVTWILCRRALALLLALLIAGFGAWTLTQQTIDAYPDISAPTVTIISTFPGRAPEEVERQVTVPIELAMGSTAKLSVIRSRTIFGLSVVQLVFEDRTDLYFARQQVTERIGRLELPPGVNPDLGPIASTFGEIYRYELHSDGSHDEIELRTLNDWVVIPRLRRISGVADVVNFGGLNKQYTILLEPAQLERFGLALDDVVNAVRANNANAGGSMLRRGEMSLVIRGRGSMQSVADIEQTVVNTISGTPVYVRDVGSVLIDSSYSPGIFGRDADNSSVEGIVLMRRGENPSRVLGRVKEEADAINADSLPAGVTLLPFYDRSFLVDQTLHTVGHSIAMGISLVVLILLVILGSPAVAALVVLTIPFSILFALVLMYFTGIPVGLLSIGAIDFGILVDGAVIMSDNIVHRIGQRQGKELDIRTVVHDAAHEVQHPIFFSMLMIIAAYLPLLSLERIEGLLFRPMALTIVFALLGAVLFSLFVVPVLATVFFRRGFVDWENPVLAASRPIYSAFLRTLLRRRYLVAAAVLALVGGIAFHVVPRLGTEFLPYLDEGVIWVRVNFPEGMALEETADHANRLRSLIAEFPEVAYVTSQAGRNDSGADPFPPSRLEMLVGPRPKDQWRFDTKQEFLAALGKTLRDEYPTCRFNFTQPIIDSVTEETNGTSANVAIELSGPDLDVLRGLAERARDVVREVSGAVDVAIEQEGPQPQLVIVPDRTLCSRYGVNIEDVNQVINLAIAGDRVSTLYEGERRFDIVTRLDRAILTSREAVERVPVYNRDHVPIPLSQVASFEIVDGETLIAREGGRRRLTVRADVLGRDQGGFVKDAQEAFAKEIVVPEGVHVRWVGMFENLARAGQHFLLVIPITIVIIYGILLATFGSQRETMLVLLAVPFAFVGGVLALYARGMHLNVSAGVGFATLFGVAIMDGVVMVEWITALRRKGLPIDEAIIQGALGRLRPIVTTSLVAILGLFPASIATGLGSDVQRPLATVIVWGLASSTILTLFLVPVLYRIFAPPVSCASDAS